MKRSIYISAFIFLWLCEICYPQYYQQTEIINPGATTPYDFVSYSSAHYFVKKSNSENMHLVYMWAPPGQPNNFPNLNIRYYFFNGSDFWADLGNVSQSKAGHPFLRVNSDDEGYISSSLAISGGSFTRTSIFKDFLSGLGVFQEFYPAFRNLIYSKSVNVSSPENNYVMIAQSPTSDSAYICRISTSSWQYIAKTPKEAYTIAKGPGSIIGITYINNSDVQSDNKCVYFIESRDEGLTWSLPLKIYQPVYNGSNADSLAAHRGISMVYMDSIPCITFDAAKFNPANNTYNLKASSKIMFWRSTLIGTDPYKSITAADTTYTPYPPADSIRTGTDDEYPIFSRPVIGLSSEPESVFIAFQTLTKHWGGIPPDTANYKAIYITISYHNGSFEIPRQISPANPLRDWSYPSISPSNPAYNWYSLNSLVAAYCDSIPGTRVLTGTNNNHNASIYILNSTFYKMVGIKKLGDLTPASFILQQNYPNPFNPSTKIKFAVPNAHNESVSIKIYDALGKELETLVDKVISSGWYEVDFNGSKYPSGVYFYKLQCNNYTETKKMILVK